MVKRNEIAWHERLAEWQGEMNATVREINKNQDILEKKNGQLLVEVAVLKTLAKQSGRRWGLICGVVAAVITALIVRFLPI